MNAFELDKKKITHEKNKCYMIKILNLSHMSDTSTERHFSSVKLYENNNELKLSHILHDDIRQLGSGRYSHWYDTLYFSTSDNSDPRTNDKTYKLIYENKI